ncbi:hypothetical protein PseudUWO311_02585 [Pseudanabaena sp. UWO311]|nr:hypothetical protein PseudUWO311_02585 [Pseudanabaena sp. UWO311]
MTKANPKRELRREVPQLSFLVCFCLNISGYSYKNIYKSRFYQKLFLYGDWRSDYLCPIL